MPLVSQRHGKGRVRIARVVRDGVHNSIRDLSVHILLDGDFDRSYTEGNNEGVVATDTVKNITNIVAREQLGTETEPFAQALANRFLERYPQVSRASVTCHETKWVRATVAGAPHPHSFLLDANGKLYVQVIAARDGTTTTSGVSGYTIMKTTQSGWVGYHEDDYTTLKETTDRIAATAMDATWIWNAAPADYAASNAKILATMFEVFATTYSHGVQDSLFRMGEAALAAVPEVATISMACPNKHYLPIDLSPFGLSGDNTVFTPTDEPHGQIECTIGR